MAASKETVRAVVAIVAKYVEPKKFDALLTELEGVPGNSSFRETIASLRREYEEKRRGK